MSEVKMEKLIALTSIKQGQEVIYYTGELAIDCSLTPNREAACHIIRKAAQTMLDRGKVALFQKRLSKCELLKPEDARKRHYCAIGL